jgi:hypothetical protein
MRLIAVLALCVLTAVGAFAVGRASADNTRERAMPGDFVIRIGDTVRVPAVNALCGAHVEARQPRFLCGRLSTDSRFQVAFERDRTVVIRVGDPGQVKVFRER